MHNAPYTYFYSPPLGPCGLQYRTSLTSVVVDEYRGSTHLYLYYGPHIRSLSLYQTVSLIAKCYVIGHLQAMDIDHFISDLPCLLIDTDLVLVLRVFYRPLSQV